MRLRVPAALAILTASVALAIAPPRPAAQGPAPAGDWPIYGHDLSNSRNGGSAGPPRRGARTLRRAWRFSSPTGGFTGTPVVSDGVVVAGSIPGTVYALDAATGAELWRWQPQGDVYLPSTAAIDGDTVYVAIDAAPVQLVALGLHDGAVRWREGVDPSGDLSLDASPVVWNGRVYLGLTGVKVEQGRARGPLRGQVVAVDAATGATVWRTNMVPEGSDGGAVWSTAAIDPPTRRLFVGTGNTYVKPPTSTTEAIVSLDADSGRIGRHFRPHLTRRQLKQDLDFGASVNLFRGPDGRRLAGELQKSGVYWALDRRTMRRVWSRQTTPRSRSLEALASTAHDGSRILGQAESGELWALSTGGRMLWRTRPRGETNYSPVAVANGVVYRIRATGVLEARSTRNGALLRRLSLGAKSWGGISIAGGCVHAVAGQSPKPPGYVYRFCPAG